MAGKKNMSLVCVATDLTNRQANQLLSEFSKAKNKIAPMCRGTAAVTPKNGIANMLQKGWKQITG